MATGALVAAGVFSSAPSAQAHTCAQVRVWTDGSPTPVGSCHYPGDPFDVCNEGDLTQSGKGFGHTVCVEVPV